MIVIESLFIPHTKLDHILDVLNLDLKEFVPLWLCTTSLMNMSFKFAISVLDSTIRVHTPESFLIVS